MEKKNKPVTIKFTEEQVKWLEQKAAEDDRDRSYIIRKLVEKEMQKESTK